MPKQWRPAWDRRILAAAFARLHRSPGVHLSTAQAARKFVIAYEICRSFEKGF
jgi:hypothetical protein